MITYYQAKNSELDLGHIHLFQLQIKSIFLQNLDSTNLGTNKVFHAQDLSWLFLIVP